MPDLRFFEVGPKLDLDQVTALTSTRLGRSNARGSGHVSGCAPLSLSGAGFNGEGKAAYFSDRRYLTDLHRTEAEFVFVGSDYVEPVPAHSVPIISARPQASRSRLA